MTTTRERAITSLATLNSVVATHINDPDDEALLAQSSGFIRAVIDGATDEQLDAAYESFTGHAFPVRCRIVTMGWRWACRSAGCGASGGRSSGVLIEDEGHTPIIEVGLPAEDHLYQPGERCLFDEQRREDDS